MPKGSCLCGYVKYEYDQAGMNALCHCLSCRKLSGSAFATTVLIPDTAFRLLSPSEDAIKTDETIHETGLTLIYRSCPKCSCTLFKSAPAGFPGSTIVFAGMLDKQTAAQNGHAVNGANDGEDIETAGAPVAELWTKYRVPWLRPLEGVKQFEEFPPHA